MEGESSQAVSKRAIDSTAKLSRQLNVKRPRVGVNTSNTGTGSMSPSQDLELHEFVFKARENPKIVANSVNNVHYDITPGAPNPLVAPGNAHENVTSGVAPVDPNWMKEYGASRPRAVPPCGSDIDVLEKGSQVADKSTAKGKQVADRVIDNILQLMYLARNRNAAIVDVGVEEVYLPAEKRNLVAVAIGDDGVGMVSQGKEFFDSKEFKDIPADYLILLTKTEKEQLVTLTHKHKVKCFSYLDYGSDGATPDAKRLNLQSALAPIEKLSPFRSFIEKEFEKIETKGTRMIDFGYRDLVFKQENVREEHSIMRSLVQTSSQRVV